MDDYFEHDRDQRKKKKKKQQQKSPHGNQQQPQASTGDKKRPRETNPHDNDSDRDSDVNDGKNTPPHSTGSSNAVDVDFLIQLAKKKEAQIASSMHNNTGNNHQSASKQEKKKQKKQIQSLPEHEDESNTQSMEANQGGDDAQKKKKKKKKNKNKKNPPPPSSNTVGEVDEDGASESEGDDDHVGSVGASGTPVEANDYPYPVTTDDHCETPVEAYQDIAPLLKLFAHQLYPQDASQLQIYDPYFCEGSVKLRLQEVGFPHVYNQKEDFYARMFKQDFPPHDLLLTNPPYSTDHMERLLVHCVKGGGSKKPFCLLIPNYVYTKDYYLRVLGQQANHVFYIVPKQGKRYQYTTPKGRRQQKSAKYTSPFPTFWYCGNFRPDMIHKLDAYLKQQPNASFELVKRTIDIPLLLAPDNDPRKKKLRNNMKRKKNKMKKKA